MQERLSKSISVGLFKGEILRMNYLFTSWINKQAYLQGRTDWIPYWFESQYGRKCVLQKACVPFPCSPCELETGCMLAGMERWSSREAQHGLRDAERAQGRKHDDSSRKRWRRSTWLTHLPLTVWPIRSSVVRTLLFLHPLPLFALLPALFAVFCSFPSLCSSSRDKLHSHYYISE